MLKQLNMLCFYKFLMQLDDPLFCYLDIKKIFYWKILGLRKNYCRSLKFKKQSRFSGVSTAWLSLFEKKYIKIASSAIIALAFTTSAFQSVQLGIWCPSKFHLWSFAAHWIKTPIKYHLK